MKESAESIAKNTAAMMGSQIITWISSFALIAIFPRFLGDEGFGRFYWAVSLTWLMAIFVELGIGNYYIIEVARARERAAELYVNGSLLRFLVWIVAMTGTMAYVLLAGYPQETVAIVFILGFTKLLEMLVEYCYRVFQAHEQLQYRSIGITVEKVFLSVVSITLLMMGFRAVAVAVVMLLSVIASFSISLYLMPRVLKLEFKINTSIWPQLLRGGLPFFINFGLSFIYYRIDILMLEKMTSIEVVGWYGASHRLFDSFMFFPSIMQVAVFPVLARLWHSSKDNLMWTTRKVFDVTTLVAMPIAVLLIMCAKPIVALIFGPAFSQSAIILQVLAVALIFVYLNFHFGSTVISTNKQKYTPFTAATAAVVNLSLNYFMIPYFQLNYGNGGIGAALVMLITEMCVSVLLLILIPRGFFGLSNIVVVAKALLGGIVMALAYHLSETVIPYWFISAFIASLVYVGALSVVRVTTKRELMLAVSLLPVSLRRFVPASFQNN